MLGEEGTKLMGLSGKIGVDFKRTYPLFNSFLLGGMGYLVAAFGSLIPSNLVGYGINPILLLGYKRRRSCDVRERYIFSPSKNNFHAIT